MSPKRIRRQRKRRPLRDRILIVCEGEKTEPNYFRAFPVKTEIYELNIRGYGNDPRTLVDRAIECVRDAEQRNAPFNQAWCVFDRDDWPANRFEGAISRAVNWGIRVAYSIQSFELWYCLHFEFLQSAINRSQYIDKLHTCLKKQYQKNAPDMYNQLKDFQEIAIRNAQNLEKIHRCIPKGQRDPSTTVYLLVQELNKFI
jgi:hypothetical protein